MPPKKEMIDSDEKTCNNDSNQPILVVDQIQSILERLSFLDFHRARCVSSEWYSASKSCNPTNPSLILFPNKYNNKGSCGLLDSRGHNTYTVTDLGFDFFMSRYLSSSGNWFLLVDSIGTSFLFLNLFTREKIPLPSLKSYKRIGKAVLWVDEETRDYIVVLNFDSFFAYHKRRVENKRWKLCKPLKNQGCVDMVLKEKKLYVLSITRNIIVIDFSCDSPKECAVDFIPSPKFYHRDRYFTNLAVTLSGEVLIIVSHVELCPAGICFFDVYKMDRNPKSSKWNIIKSIGDEVLLLDLGITVAAKDGVMRNCICFSDDQSQRQRKGISLFNDYYRICVYHIRTDKVSQRFQRLPRPLKDARWFLPTFGGKCLPSKLGIKS